LNRLTASPAPEAGRGRYASTEKGGLQLQFHPPPFRWAPCAPQACRRRRRTTSSSTWVPSVARESGSTSGSVSRAVAAASSFTRWGARLVWADDAVVVEREDPERFTRRLGSAADVPVRQRVVAGQCGPRPIGTRTDGRPCPDDRRRLVTGALGHVHSEYGLRRAAMESPASPAES